MTGKEFNKVVEEQFERCKDILCVKAGEYSSNKDRLHNFKCAAGYRNQDPKDALWGMATKHFVSISDMCQDGKQHSLELWEEKITDALNYLFLLRGLVEEDMKNNYYASIPMGKYCPGIDICGTSRKPDPSPNIICENGDACNIEELLNGVNEVAPEEPLAHGYPKNKLVCYDLIDKIHVICPNYGQERVLNPDEPELICPICGDFHTLKDYKVWYKDGYSYTAETVANVDYLSK